MFDRIVNEHPDQWTSNLAAEGSDLAACAMRELRSLSHLLYPPPLQEGGLVASVQWYLDGLTKRSGIETSLDDRRLISKACPRSRDRHFLYHPGGSDQRFPARRSRQGMGDIELSGKRSGGYGKGRRKGHRRASCRIGACRYRCRAGGMLGRAKELGGELRVSKRLVEVVLPVRESAVKGAA
jgi:hypothetical protein